MNALPHHNKQKGAVLVLVTVALFVLLGFTALALDGGYLLLNKNRLQDAVDAAALSGAKTLADDKANHADAIQAVRDTMKAIMEGDGFNKMNVDTSKLADIVKIEFSDEPVPFAISVNEDARYIRVRMETVPVTQFFSQLMVDVWQVRASAVAGSLPPAKGNQICDVIPLLMLVDEGKKGLGDFYGYNMASPELGSEGDIIVMKSPAGGNPNMAPGNFQALKLGDQNGADGYRDGLAGGNCITLDNEYEVDECPESNPNCTLTVVNTDSKTGNMAGPTRQGLNTRFNVYNPGKFKAPSVEVADAVPGDDSYYSDCSLTSAVVDFHDNKLTGYLQDIFNDGSTTKEEIVEVFDNYINNPDEKNNVIKEAEKYKNEFLSIQTYSQYLDKSGPHVDYKKQGKDVDCIQGRRIVKVPVAVGGADVGKNIPIIGVACMFLNQEVTGNGLSQYVVGEFIPECGSDGTGGEDEFGKKPKLVLYNDVGSEDS